MYEHMARTCASQAVITALSAIHLPTVAACIYWRELKHPSQCKGLSKASLLEYGSHSAVMPQLLSSWLRCLNTGTLRCAAAVSLRLSLEGPQQSTDA